MQQFIARYRVHDHESLFYLLTNKIKKEDLNFQKIKTKVITSKRITYREKKSNKK